MSDATKILQVMGFLNDLWRMFDSSLEKYDVYKVDTIGKDKSELKLEKLSLGEYIIWLNIANMGENCFTTRTILRL